MSDDFELTPPEPGEPGSSAELALDPIVVVDEAEIAMGQATLFPITDQGIITRKELQAMLDEPYPCAPGQAFKLCGRHILMVDNVVEPPHRWMKFLDDHQMFIPWPDVLAADVFNGTHYPVVMVQPDPFIAGSLLNYYVVRHGEEAVELL